ncbi:uncharacterized protein LOC118259578 [Cygnus atratus]|uniref:uncharacterized protein LOC118259578 n=1 Tax=Cygnus atratus TaxID=8868 RepID=UPI0021B81218|nr:uncharacterized protein LOC118259578 [Cygnus atratus]
MIGLQSMNLQQQQQRACGAACTSPPPPRPRPLLGASARSPPVSEPTAAPRARHRPPVAAPSVPPAVPLVSEPPAASLRPVKVRLAVPLRAEGAHGCLRAGRDKMHLKVLRELADEVAKLLSITFMKLWQSSEVPTEWKRET